MFNSQAKSLARIGGRSGNAILCRHAHQHRMIQIQLKSDIPGLGTYGTLQTVSPGRMRNHLFPKGLANYVLKGVEPPVLTRAGTARAKPSQSSFDLSEFKTKITTLLPNQTLTIYRRAVHTETQSSLAPSTIIPPPHGTPIYGSVTSHDILLALSEALKSPEITSQNVAIIIPDSIQGGKLRTTGEYLVRAQLPRAQESDIVELKVAIKDSGIVATTSAGLEEGL